MDLKGNRMRWYGLDSSGAGKGGVEGTFEHGNGTFGKLLST
jgi:hypothetical protein